MDDVFSKFTELFYSSEIRACVDIVETVAGFKISSSDRQAFLYFHDYVTNPQPDFVTAWRNDPKQEKWYHKFTNGILGDVQSGFACVLYHYDRLIEIENKVLEQIERHDYRKVLGDSTLALSNTLKWDFEYQAFVLAIRRCLDYLARAISAYFMNDFHSFRKISDFLQKQKRPKATRQMIEIHTRYCADFEFVISKGMKKSVRDKITHYNFIHAGCINLSRRGFVFSGGGEELARGSKVETTLLSEVLNNHISNFRNCVRELIIAYVDGMRSDQYAKDL